MTAERRSNTLVETPYTPGMKQGINGMNSLFLRKLTRSPKTLKALVIGGLVVTLLGTLKGVGATDTEASATRFESGEKKVSLIELYTSEGCSSCPPADRWLTSLKEGEALWENVVPVAFHVSYWDRLGWPDRFAQRKFDTRQRQVAQRANSGVYTPGVFRDGQEFRSWRRNTVQSIDAAFTAASERSPAAGNLQLEDIGNDRWALSYQPAPGTADQIDQAFVAVLGNNLSNAIQRGENAGRKLDHDFVVLHLDAAKLQRTDNNSLRAEFKLDPRITAQPALAAWVVDHNGTPVQALGGLL